MRKALALLAVLILSAPAYAQNIGSPGNVQGAASSTDGHCALFNGTSGKRLKDGGACPGGGGGSLSDTDGTTTVTGVTAQTFGNGFVVSGSTPNATINAVTPRSTKSADYTVAAVDMAGVINLTGTHTLTIPAISSTVLASGMSVCYSNIGSGTWTISTTPTINGMTGTSIPPGGAGCWVSNGTTLDYQPGAQLGSSTILGSFTAKGNTTVAATASGAFTSGNCIKSDASGNLIDAATTCGGSGGGSTFAPTGYVSGLYYTGLYTTEGNATIVANRLYAIHFMAGATGNLTKIAVNVTTLAVGGNCELGVYNDAAGIPSTLLLDGGHVSTTTTGKKELTGLTIALTAGTHYWLVVGCDNGTELLTGALNTDLAANYFNGTDTPGVGAEQIYGAWTYVANSLPGTYPTVTHNTGPTPIVWTGK